MSNSSGKHPKSSHKPRHPESGAGVAGRGLTPLKSSRWGIVVYKIEYSFFEHEFLDEWNNSSLPVGGISLAYFFRVCKLFIVIMKSIMLRNDCTNLHDWAFQYGEFATLTLLLLPKRGLKTLC
jgi:hypothetical protein